MKTFRTSLLSRIAIGIIAIMNSSAAFTGAQQPDPSSAAQPLTIAETSDFQATSQSAEVVAYIDACAAKARNIKKFVFGKTVEGRDMVGVVVANEYYELGDQDRRNVILLLGNIHSGECAGKEALLMMLREMANDYSHPWLEQNVIIFVPNFNADANDRMGLLNRPGQIGPDKGMGRRENAQELDLNRDFGKLESPEVRALVGLIDKVNPHLFVDCHTTNGSKHRYALTYDIPHNPTTAEPIRNFLREKMMPTITQKLADAGTDTFYYGNFNEDNSAWVTFGHEPRYSTEYVGLRGRLAILSEAYSYISYRDRIFATKDFLSAVLDYASEHQVAIHKMLDSVDSYLVQMADAQPERISISLAAKPNAFAKKFKLKGFKDDQPHDYDCDFIGHYLATDSTPLPYAYLIPPEYARVVDRLRMHGIEVRRLVDSRQMKVEIDTITDVTRQPTPFQRHHLVRAEASRELVDRRLNFGSYVVQTDQPLGRLASYLLESASDDGFVCWNFFDVGLEVGTEYPVWRLPDPQELMVEEVNQVERLDRISLESIDGPRGLLDGLSPAVQWLGKTNLLKTEIYNQEMLIDAESASFVEKPACPYDAEEVKLALTKSGFSAEDAALMVASNVLISDNGKFAVFTGTDQSFVYFVSGDRSDADNVLLLGNSSDENRQSKRRTNATDSSATVGELFEFNHDESRLAYVTNHGLHLLDLASRAESVVAADNKKNLIGKLDWVYQEELYGRGNFKAFWWNPTDDQVAFLSLDESPVIPFAVMDHLPIRGKSEITNYPKAGDPLPRVKLGVVSATGSADVTWVDLSQYAGEGIKQFLVSRVTWSSDGETLMIQIQNREQTWLDLVAANRNGTDLRVVFRDQTPAWIESPGDPVFISPSEFLWLSPRDGFNRIYKYGLDGTPIDVLTTENWEVRELLGVDADQSFAYFTGSDNGIDLQAYRLNLKSNTITKLTTRPGNHLVEFSRDFSMFLDHFSTVSQPTETNVCRNDGQLLRLINARSDDRLKYLEINDPEFMTVVTQDGTTLDAMVIKPPDFSEVKKYPVLIHVYGGPQTPRVRNRFDDAQYLWHQMLAQRGYVIWICDNRSASYRNSKNVWPIHKQLAVHELEDIETGVEWLKKQSWVDSDRIGIWGWSYGGYMTLYAMTHSQSFKMGIAGAPVTDWKNYDAIYTERYMGLPQENPGGYESASVLSKANQLQGRLLLVHGTIDDNVHLNNSVQMIKELQNAGTQFSLMIYPDSRHSVRDKKQLAHLRKLMTDFIADNL